MTKLRAVPVQTPRKSGMSVQLFHAQVQEKG